MPTARRIATPTNSARIATRPPVVVAPVVEGRQHDVVGGPAEHPGVGDGQGAEEHAAERRDGEDPRLAADRDPEHAEPAHEGGRARAARGPGDSGSGAGSGEGVFGTTGATLDVGPDIPHLTWTGSVGLRLRALPLASPHGVDVAHRARSPVQHRPPGRASRPRPCAATGRSRTSSSTCWCASATRSARPGSCSRRSRSSPTGRHDASTSRTSPRWSSASAAVRRAGRR